VATTVSIQHQTLSAGTDRMSAKLLVLTGQAASPFGNVLTGSSTTNNLTTAALTTTVGSFVGWSGCEWNALAGSPASTDLTLDSIVYTSQIGVASGYKTATTTSTTANLDAGGSAAAAWNWVALEILAASGGGAAASLPPVQDFLQPVRYYRCCLPSRNLWSSEPDWRTRAAGRSTVRRYVVMPPFSMPKAATTGSRRSRTSRRALAALSAGTR
jgi:hypothetical protein